MPHGPELDRLAARLAERPDSTCFAALAEGLRKGGALEEAASVARRGVTARPDYLPGHLVLARVHRDRQQWTDAERELRIALAIDPAHPVVIDALAQLADLSGAPAMLTGGESADARDQENPDDADMVYSDGDSGDSRSADAVMTESMAMLYWSQGHLESAVEVFAVLVARDPGNTDLAVRLDAARAELDAQRPRPFDAAQSGGDSVRAWLGSIAAARGPATAPVSSFDAFYQTDATPPSEHGDMAAFQAWLKELGR
jgi:tetratricopeptide (TPR) repeat protein